MTTEEKAKAYDNALERARLLKLANPDDEAIQTFVKDSFPELKESEDERIRKELLAVINDLVLPDEQKARFNAWLEKQKEQKPAEWSEEDKFKLEDAITGIDAGIGFYEAEGKHPNLLKAIIEAKEWLKSLRPQPKKELSIEKAIKWLDDTFYFLDNSSGRGKDCEITTHDFDSLEEMYDSFRKAVIVDSEPHWKPSEEQMTTLLRAEGVVRVHDTKELAAAIAQLYEQLKKLM